MEMRDLVEEEVAVDAVGVDYRTLMETTILSHLEVAVVVVEDLVEVIQTMVTKAVVDLAAPEVDLVVDLNHPLKMEMITREVSEEEEVDLEGTGVALTLQETTIQDLVTEEVVEVLEAEEVDLIQGVIMKMKTPVALAAREAVEALEVDEADLVLQMTMMKILEDLVTEEVMGALETEEVDLTLWIITIMKMKILGALVAEEAVEVSVEAGEDLVPVVTTERRAQAHVVVLAPDEAASVDSNHPTMEKKGLATKEGVVLADLELPMMRKMTVSPEDVGEAVAEVDGDEAAPVVATMMMATLTPQNLVVSILNYKYYM